MHCIVKFERIYVHFTDIAVNTSEDEMKAILEGEFGREIGTVAVTRGGDCHGYNWYITFKTVGGDVETMEVVGTSSDLETTVSVDTIQDGGIVYGPFTSDFLQLKKESPQVC